MHERDVFTAALAIEDAAARGDYLAAACGDDGALRRRVETLLKAYEVASLFLERPILAEPPAVAGPPGDDGPPLDFLGPAERPGSLGRLAHYEVLEVVGRGGFGTVVRAFDAKLHRVVAIKVMARDLAATSPPRQRFLREARAAAAIRHENVVNIHAVDDRPVPYLVMEYVAGPTLQAKLDQAGPIEAPEVLRIGIQVAEGLAAAHRQGLIHRDIKPANILLEEPGERVKLTDFGLARAADDASLTQSGVIAGTPLYMAPEQARGEAIDHRADLFSLGSVLYVMCTGRPPFRAPSMLAVLRRVAEDAPRPIREIMPDVPAPLCALIARLHAKNPADRCASAEEVAGLLRAQLAASRSDAPPPPPKPKPRPQPAAADPNFLLITAEARRSRFGIARGRLRAAAEVFWFLAAAALVALVILEGAGMVNLRGFLAHQIAPVGALVVRCDDATTSYSITGEDVDIRCHGGVPLHVAGANVKLVPLPDRSHHIYRLKAGTYRLIVRDGDQVLMDQQLTVAPNSRETIHVPPLIARAEAQPAPPASPHAPAPPTAPGDLLPWGDYLIDPAAGCRARVVEHQLTIATREGRPRDLDPAPGANLDAPRILAGADEDFVFRSEVQPFSKPRPGVSLDPSVPAQQPRRHGAGLVLWADDRNFVRFIRERGDDPDDDSSILRLEIFRDGRRTVQETRRVGGPATYLQLDRRGDVLRAAYLEGGSWNFFKSCAIPDLPGRVAVGPVVINTAADDFSARFEGRELVLLPTPDR